MNAKLCSVRCLGRKRAAVKVRRIGKTNKYEIVPGSIAMLSEEVKVGEKQDAIVVDENGEIVEPTGKFLWTAETINPFHLVTDINDNFNDN